MNKIVIISLAPEMEELNIYLSATNKITIARSERKLMHIKHSKKFVNLAWNLFMDLRFCLSTLFVLFGSLPML